MEMSGTREKGTTKKGKEEKGELGLLVQALEGAEIVIEMRNESMIRGRLAHATPAMEYAKHTHIHLPYRIYTPRIYNSVCVCVHDFSKYIEREVWSIKYGALLETYGRVCRSHTYIMSRSLVSVCVLSCVQCSPRGCVRGNSRCRCIDVNIVITTFI